MKDEGSRARGGTALRLLLAAFAERGRVYTIRCGIPGFEPASEGRGMRNFAL